MSETTSSLESLLADGAWLRRIARGLVRGDDLAEDVLQDTCVYALSHPPRHRGNLRGWLARIARSTARQILRGEERRRRREAVAAPPRDDSPDPADAVARVEFRRRIAAAVLELPEPARTALVLRYFEEVEPTEIARRQGVPASTVRSRIARGLACLRRRLDEDHGGDRRAWSLLLLPFCLPDAAVAAAAVAGGAGATVTGALLMSTKAKVGIAVVIAIGIGIAIWQGSGGPGPARKAPGEAPPLAGLAETGTGDAAKEEPPPESPEKEPETPPADRVAEMARIAGRVMWEDGTPAQGILLTAYFEEMLLAPEHRYGVTVTAEDGTFTFPAVRDAPYGLSLRITDNVLRKFKDRRRIVRGGAEDIVFTLPRATSLIVALTDAETGEGVTARYYTLRWDVAGKWKIATGFPAAALPRYNRLPRPPAEDAERVLMREDRFRILLPPREAPDDGVRLKLTANGYEPTTIEIGPDELGLDLPERSVPMRPLPGEGEGWTLEVTASYEEGGAARAKGKVILYRGEEEVQEVEFDVTDGAARVPGLALGADRALIVLEQRWSQNVKPCPVRTGEVRTVEVALPLRWEILIDPQFEGEPRRLGVRVKLGKRLPSWKSVGGGEWPYTARGKGAGTALVVLEGKDEREVVSFEVEVAPGTKETVKPVVPAEGR